MVQVSQQPPVVQPLSVLLEQARQQQQPEPVEPAAPAPKAPAQKKAVPYYKVSKISRESWLSAPYHIWIRHVDNTKNNTLIVYKWRKEKDRIPCFRAAARQLRNYKGKQIAEARFYVNTPGGFIWGYYKPVNGEMLFTGGAEFMNRL